jgi:hypothetical protein
MAMQLTIHDGFTLLFFFWFFHGFLASEERLGQNLHDLGVFLDFFLRN